MVTMWWGLGHRGLRLASSQILTHCQHCQYKLFTPHKFRRTGNLHKG